MAGGAAVLWISLCAAAWGDQSVSLAWNASTDPNVVGYKIYYGSASRAYTNVVDVGNATSVTVFNLVEGSTYYFAATAYSLLGEESDYSNETSYTVPSTTSLAPTVTLTSPPNGMSYTAPAVIDLAASVTANGHAIVKVQFYNGAMLLGETATAPYSFSWGNVDGGNYNLTAAAVYDADTTVSSPPANVAVAVYDVPGFDGALSNEVASIAPGVLLLTPASNRSDPGTLKFSVAPGHGYEIQATEDLKSWTTIWQMATAPSNGGIEFVDPQASAYRKRFYRLVVH